MDKMLGSWSGQEEMFDSPWSQAGTAFGRFIVTAGPPGVLLRDYRQHRADGSEFLAHEVYQQQADGEIWLFTFDSFGFPPLEPARGNLQESRLSLIKTTPRGQARHRWLLSETLDYQVEIAVGNTAEFLPFLRASYQAEPTS